MDTEGALVTSSGEAYTGEPFVLVSDRSPSTKATHGSNSAHLTARVDERTEIGASRSPRIDNLVKEAAGQAIQSANIVLGLPETTGLSQAGCYP